jgi:hypothetical protein
MLLLSSFDLLWYPRGRIFTSKTSTWLGWYMALIRLFPFYLPKFHLSDLVSFGPVCAVPLIFTRFSYMEDFNFGCLFTSITGPLLISCYKIGPCKARVPPYTRAYCFLERMVAAAFWARYVDEGIQLPGNTPWWHDRVCFSTHDGRACVFHIPITM